MTIPDFTARIVADDEIEPLCRALSRDIYQPSAIQVLYFLLQSAVQHGVQEWDQIGRAIRKTHAESLQIATFGPIPDLHRLELQEGNSKSGHEAPWGVAILWKDETDPGVRGRFWISTETQANVTAASWHPDGISVALLHAMCHGFFRPFLEGLEASRFDTIFFNGTNQCWTKALSDAGDNLYDGKCTKAVRRIALNSTSRVECPPGYRVRGLMEKDIQTVIDSNKIRFSHDYVRSRLYLSVAVVSAETDELASWAIAHADLSIGALHTVPAYRKRGLAAIVVATLGNAIQKAIIGNRLATEILKDAFWAHAECQAFNVVVMNWFCSLGFEKVVDNTWTKVKFT